MMWCENCGCAVQEDYTTEIINHSEVDAWCREEIHYPTCPMCGREVDIDADECGCGEWKSKEDYACPSCREDIEPKIREIKAELMYLGWNEGEAIDAIFSGADEIYAEYAAEQRRK